MQKLHCVNLENNTERFILLREALLGLVFIVPISQEVAGSYTSAHHSFPSHCVAAPREAETSRAAGSPRGAACQRCGRAGASTDLVTSVDVYNQTSLFLYTGDMSGSLYLGQ